jgi:ABC-2 type transport system ATP-binding protein
MSSTVVQVHDVSKWYGEVLGVNRVKLEIPHGVTSLVGPNGCGKSTLMNMITGLLQPSKGSITIHGIAPTQPEVLHRRMGYCTSIDSFHDTFTGDQWLLGLLQTHGYDRTTTREMADAALERVGLTDARNKRIAAYSKGMRQRLKLALAIAHEPDVLILDEPLNGLDPLGRSEVINLLRDLADNGATVLISSHILHEVDLVSENVVMLHHGYVVAEGGIQDVRSEISDKPLQVRVFCDRPAHLAARAFEDSSVKSARLEKTGVLVETVNTRSFAALVAKLATEDAICVEGLEMADDNVQAVYDYLIGPAEGQS